MSTFMIDITHLSITVFTLTDLKSEKKRFIHFSMCDYNSDFENVNLKEGVGVNERREAREDSGMLRPSR